MVNTAVGRLERRKVLEVGPKQKGLLVVVGVGVVKVKAFGKKHVCYTIVLGERNLKGVRLVRKHRRNKNPVGIHIVARNSGLVDNRDTRNPGSRRYKPVHNLVKRHSKCVVYKTKDSVFNISGVCFRCNMACFVFILCWPVGVPTSPDQFRRHIVAKNPQQPADGVMVPAELWDDNRCRELTGPLFDTIQHGPYKADLCRLYVLYHHGGVYTDDDIFLLTKPKLQNLTVIRESPLFKASAAQIGLFNAYIEVPSRHNMFVLQAIQRSTENVHVLQQDPHALWGPLMLRDAFKWAPKVVLQEECRATPCDCHVERVLISHKPCRY